MDNDRGFWMRALLAVYCTLPCVLGLIPELQGELVAWRDPRVAMIQNVVVMESTGIFTRPDVLMDQPGLPLYSLNLSQCIINFRDPWSEIGTIFPKTTDSSTVPTIGGALFHDNYEYYSFGGMLSVPIQDTATRMSLCVLFPTSPDTTFVAGYVSNYQAAMGPVSDNLCCGADVSVPSLGLAFYLGGLAPENITAPLTYPYPYSTRNGTDLLLTRSFVMCDLSVSSRMECSYRNVPYYLPSVAEAGLIWIPYGRKGSLIYVGGTTQPADLQLNTTNTSNAQTSDFLTNVWIYDISADVWYNQTTSTAPGYQLPAEIASFCNVIVETADGRNHHIYIYGGYDGTAETVTASDQVWILVLPSFTWVLAAEGNPQHRRQNHKCVLPSPTQMISIGGMIEGGRPIQDSILDMFNLNTLSWTSTYSGGTIENYNVPDSVVAAVGGTKYGGVEIPKDLDPAVSQLFSAPFPGMILSFYPYANCNDGNTSNGTSASRPGSLASRLGLPDWMGAVLAISLSLIISLWAILALVAIRRRTYIRAANVDASIIESNNFVVRWMHDAPSQREKGKEKSTVIVRDSFTPLKLTYVDDEEVSESTTAGKSTSSSIGTYERSFLDENGEIELRTFIGSNQTRALRIF